MVGNRIYCLHSLCVPISSFKIRGNVTPLIAGLAHAQSVVYTGAVRELEPGGKKMSGFRNEVREMVRHYGSASAAAEATGATSWSIGRMTRRSSYKPHEATLKSLREAVTTWRSRLVADISVGSVPSPASPASQKPQADFVMVKVTELDSLQASIEEQAPKIASLEAQIETLSQQVDTLSQGLAANLRMMTELSRDWFGIPS